MKFHPKKKQYQAIFFDWNKTLSNSLFWEQLENPEHERYGWNVDISRYLFKENRHLISEWMKGMIDAWQIVEKISLRYGYSSDILLEDLIESCRNMKFVSDEVLPLIQKLRGSGVQCVIATDNMDTFMKYTVPGMELERYFDGFLSSFDLKRFKYDTEGENIPFFDNYLQQYGFSYADVILIDDSPDTSGVYERLGFDILQIADADDFVNKLRCLADWFPQYIGSNFI